jgi:hydrogenase-4 component F
VEAPTSFSVFLSGFLVKLALFGLYRFYPIMGASLKAAALALLFVGGVAASAAFFKQTDYKRMVAYATVQEMAQLSALLMVLGHQNPRLVGVFIVVHSLLSAVFFFISDVLYRIFKSRCTNTISGLIVVAPKLSICVVSALLAFKGLPFTSKHLVELSMLETLLDTSYLLLTMWLAFIVVMGNMGISVATLRTLVFVNQPGQKISDVTPTEFSYLIVGILFVFTFFTR